MHIFLGYARLHAHTHSRTCTHTHTHRVDHEFKKEMPFPKKDALGIFYTLEIELKALSSSIYCVFSFEWDIFSCTHSGAHSYPHTHTHTHTGYVNHTNGLYLSITSDHSTEVYYQLITADDLSWFTALSFVNVMPDHISGLALAKQNWTAVQQPWLVSVSTRLCSTEVWSCSVVSCPVRCCISSLLVYSSLSLFVTLLTHPVCFFNDHFTCWWQCLVPVFKKTCFCFLFNFDIFVCLTN